MTKRCSVCKETKSIDEFGLNNENPDKKNYQCKVCRREMYRKYSKRPEAYAKQKARSRKMTSGFTKEYWDETFKAQEGKCAICGTTDSGKLDFCADHCHETKQPRGILCRKCNSGIGLLKDNIENLKAAIAYLEYYRAQLETKEETK